MRGQHHASIAERRIGPAQDPDHVAQHRGLTNGRVYVGSDASIGQPRLQFAIESRRRATRQRDSLAFQVLAVRSGSSNRCAGSPSDVSPFGSTRIVSSGLPSLQHPTRSAQPRHQPRTELGDHHFPLHFSRGEVLHQLTIRQIHLEERGVLQDSAGSSVRSTTFFSSISNSDLPSDNFIRKFAKFGSTVIIRAVWK